MTASRFDPGPIHLLRLGPGEDLVGSITAYAKIHDIRSASVTLLGAVRSASLRYFDQHRKDYRDFRIARPLEVTSGIGNISILDDEPFLHAHATFSDEDGQTFSGHINFGTEVFHIEATIQELDGVAPVREMEELTGLMVWSMDR